MPSIRLNHHRSRTGEPLLLLHPTWRAWLPLIPALAARHDVVAVDLPGFGGSRLLPLTPTADRLASTVEGELDQLGIETCCVAGNSLGGWVALELARRGRARAVVAISPIGLGTDRENRRTRRRLGVVRALAKVARPIVGPAAWTAVGRAIFAGAGLQLARPWRHERAAMLAAVRDYWLAPGFGPALDWAFAHRVDGLDEIRCPVTIAWGTWDRLLPYRQAVRFQAAIRGAELRPLRRLGHVPMSDDPEQVAEVILEGAESDRNRIETARTTR
jgi:pimeloyl-ACP methyl ester carboxylesterase